METKGRFNTALGANTFGFEAPGRFFLNLEAPSLYEEALQRREAMVTSGGALLAETGVHTGRSPKDKFVVRDASTEDQVWWDNNGALKPADFATLLADFKAHAKGKDLFVQDLYGGADPANRVKVRVFTEYAWHSLFIRNLLIRPEVQELAAFTPEMTIVDLPSFKADPKRHGCRTETVIAVDFTRKIVDFGHGRRLATMPQRIAMFATYLGCSRPGCTRPSSQTEAHHGILDYADGGATDLADLAPACGPDNRNVGTRPGQWETGRITDGPDAGLIGWRLAGTADPFRVNRVHDPRAYLRGTRFDDEQARESDVAPPGDTNPPTSATEHPGSPRRRSGPTMLRTRPDHRGSSLNGLPRQRHPARDRQPRPGHRQSQRSRVETAIESRLISVA